MDPRLSVGRVATVAVAPPEPSSRTVGMNGISGSFAFGKGGAEIEGRLSLGMAAGLIVALLGFYYWTRTAQGGG